ncbi:MAG: DUF393 domain-containing protein [Candidatus Peribacteraceae bacterium]|nr:DUF393 domain-containing protein [Candidatus Peribacteraceae bacterium]
MKIFRTIDAFFFGRVSATGFGLMRAMWGASVLAYFLKQWPDVTRYYSAAGELPPWLSQTMTNPSPGTSILWLFPHPQAVFAIYLLLLVCAACACVGLRPRITTIVTTLLVMSFHVRNPWHTTGGDVLLRMAGVLLSVAPAGVHAFSWQRARLQCRHWVRTRKLLPPLTMPAWPQRMLLWQLIVLYSQSMWSKLLGTMWWDGTAVGIALHHTHFGRFAVSPISDVIGIAGPMLGWAFITWESCWLLLLVPRNITAWWPADRLRRWLLATSFLIHMTFYALLRLGSFLTAIPTVLLGNLHENDFTVMRATVNRRWKGKISVFYDGDCGFCLRSMGGIVMMDWLRRLRPVDFRSSQEHHKWAPDLELKNLDRAMHIRLPAGKTLHGFSAFRALAWHLPPLWLLASFLYLPGVKRLGDVVYRSIAENRKKCSHGHCKV